MKKLIIFLFLLFGSLLVTGYNPSTAYAGCGDPCGACTDCGGEGWWRLRCGADAGAESSWSQCSPPAQCQSDNDFSQFAGCDTGACGYEYWRCPATGATRRFYNAGGNCAQSSANPACEPACGWEQRNNECYYCNYSREVWYNTCNGEWNYGNVQRDNGCGTNHYGSVCAQCTVNPPPLDPPPGPPSPNPPPPSLPGGGSLNISISPTSGGPSSNYTTALFGRCGSSCEANVSASPSAGSCSGQVLRSGCPNWRWEWSCIAPASSGNVNILGRSNCGTRNAGYTVTSPADLIISSVTIDPPSPITGNLMSFTGVVNNQGGSSAPISTTRFKLDIGNNGRNDLLADFTTNALATSATETENWTSAWTATTGTHKIEVCADIADVVSESSNTNNCAPIVFTVYPPLVVSCVGSPPNAIINETTVVWSASPTGGTGIYTYSWSGTDLLSGSTQTVNKIYSTQGTKSGSVTVSSGTQTKSCSNSVSVGLRPFIQTTGGDVHEQE